MTNEELQNKIQETNLALIEIKGDIKVLTTSVNAYVTASNVAELALDKRVTSIEKRIWGALLSGFGGLLGFVISWFKH